MARKAGLVKNPRNTRFYIIIVTLKKPRNNSLYFLTTFNLPFGCLQSSFVIFFPFLPCICHVSWTNYNFFYFINDPKSLLENKGCEMIGCEES